jgi:hypothetical protein
MAIRVDFNTGTTLEPVWADITSFVRSVSVSRGKEELLSGFSAGSASIELDNRDRRFDPLFTSSPYYGDIVPRREVRVFSNYGTSGIATRTNLALNPSAEYPASTAIAGAFDTQDVTAWDTRLGAGYFLRLGVTPDSNAFGSASLYSVVDYLTTTFTATASTYYTVSAYMRIANTSPYKSLPVTTFNMYLQYFGTELQPEFQASITPTTEWTRIFITSQAPIGASSGNLTFATNGSLLSDSGRYFQVDGLLVEEGRELNTYFDGDRGQVGPSAVYSWNGTPGSATSTASFTQETGQVFSGYIDDWDLTYELGGNNTATIKASDGFNLLANQTIPNETMPIEPTGQRINRLINSGQILWPDNARNIDFGVKFLGTDVTTSANALSYLQQIELSELGQLFVAKNGDLTFLDASRNNPTPSSDPTTFSDDGMGIRFTSLEVVYGSEQLTNELTVTFTTGSETATNDNSVTAYGVTSLAVDTLNQNSTDAAYLADYYTNRFGDPQYRVDSITVNVLSLTGTKYALAARDLELGDIVIVKFTPGNVAPQIVQYAKVVRINSNISDGGKRYEIEFGLETFQTFPMILNDAVYGKLDDTYVLGF